MDMHCIEIDVAESSPVRSAQGGAQRRKNGVVAHQLEPLK